MIATAGTKMTASVLFSVTAQGAGDVGVPAPLSVSEILVTAEPAGGSLVPTHPAVIVFPGLNAAAAIPALASVQ